MLKAIGEDALANELPFEPSSSDTEGKASSEKLAQVIGICFELLNTDVRQKPNLELNLPVDLGERLFFVGKRRALMKRR